GADIDGSHRPDRHRLFHADPLLSDQERVMDTDKLALLCTHINNFGQWHNWRFKAVPVILWEFSSVGDFANAVSQLSECMHKRWPEVSGQIMRQVSPSCIEIDACGVIFRLVCLDIRMTERGPMGAADLVMGGKIVQKTDLPPPFHDQ